jgi:NAD(P)-dependent dehydrogenase (short-subunit alcohol dehydrogenase family)
VELKDSTVIVTGASSGIGRAAAARFARAGSNVVLSSRNHEALEALAQELGGLPGRRLVVPTDVSDRDAVFAMVERTVEEFGSIEVLVNNAGLGLNATVAEGSLQNIRRVFEVNFFGAVNCIQAAVPHMKQRRRGAIAIVSSVVGRLAPPYSGAYSATKGALNALTDSLRLELEPYGVTVTAVYPGYTRTGFQENLLREIEMPRPSRLVPGVGPEAVARKIVRAVREGKREAYVTRGDAAAVMIKNLSPRLIDWGMRRLWLSGRRPEPVRKR